MYYPACSVDSSLYPLSSATFEQVVVFSCSTPQHQQQAVVDLFISWDSGLTWHKLDGSFTFYDRECSLAFDVLQSGF